MPAPREEDEKVDEVDARANSQLKERAHQVIKIIQSNSVDENIDFTQNMLNFAYNMEKQQIISGLLPGL